MRTAELLFSGYEVKKKGLHYYKCNKTGCKNNRRAEVMHGKFNEMLNMLTINPAFIEPLKEVMTEVFYELNKENAEADQGADKGNRKGFGDTGRKVCFWKDHRGYIP